MKAERMNLIYWMGWYLCRFIARNLTSMQTEGLENFPMTGGVIIASTHTATLDPVILGCAFPRPLFFMAKEELFRFLPFSGLIRMLGAFPVRRGQPDRRALRKAIHLLRRNRCLVIFPEGTRNPSNQLLQPELGVSLLASWSKVSVLPVAILGSENLMAKGRLFPKLSQLLVRIGKPIYFEGDFQRDNLEAFAWEVMDCISQLSGRPLPRK